jgi:hypothetical protein
MSMALPGSQFIHSYLFLRRWIGIIGVALPIVLIVVVAWRSGELLSSISASYYSELRDVFVGSMCATGVFLIFYKGLDWWDDASSILAGAMGILLAVFPTRPAKDPTNADKVIGYFHIGFSAVFFLTLAAICLFLFTRPEIQPLPDPARKQMRNTIYRACGIAILTCLAGILLFGAFLESQTRSWHPVLWLEAGAIFAFGAAWLVKGKTLFPNRPPEQQEPGISAGSST